MTARMTIPRTASEQALDFAGLGPSALRTAPHPDTGQDCVMLEAGIDEYSVFLLGLVIQFRMTQGAWTAHSLTALASGVQLQMGADGDTRFWFPGASFEEL